MTQLIFEIVNLTDELFSFVDKEYRYREVNQAYLKVHNRKREDFIGIHVSDILGADQFSITKNFLDRCFGGEVVSYEQWFEFSYGQKHYLYVTYTPYKKDNEILGAIVSAKNYTQKKLLEEERARNKELLLHNAKMSEIGSMASFLNHQWRSPLNSLAGNFLKLRALANQVNENALFEKTLSRGEEILEQISDDLETFRDFYNPNQLSEEVNLDDTVLQVCAFLEEKICQLDVALEVCIPKKMQIVCKKSDLTHLLMIFINNSLDALHRNNTLMPAIQIVAKKRTNRLLLSIEDNGGGIDEKILKELFVNFISTKEGKLGSGIGLFFAKIIAKERLGAKISLKNTLGGLKALIEIPI
ncbi:MAG: PAS domain S-box protein [Campylobacteraceae bacterium]|nr:PAS domain S-box protein [Campylobacteraceae bacterium]